MPNYPPALARSLSTAQKRIYPPALIRAVRLSYLYAVRELPSSSRPKTLSTTPKRPPNMADTTSSATIIDGTTIAKYECFPCLTSFVCQSDFDLVVDPTLYLFVFINDFFRKYPVLEQRTIRDDVAQAIKVKQGRYPRFQPHLVIIQAGTRPDSSVYVRMKEKAAAEVGIKYSHIQLPAEAKVEQVIKEVQRLNVDEGVSGILVQLPLGDHVDSDGERQVTEAISPDKDVDG